MKKKQLFASCLFGIICLYHYKTDYKSDTTALLSSNIEALSQNSENDNTAESKEVETESYFLYHEIVETDSTAVYYKCYQIMEYVECYGEGDLPCVAGYFDKGIKKVKGL